MKQKISRLEVYQLLTGIHKKYPGIRHCCSKISEILDVSKQRINVLIKDWEYNGYITCDNHRANPKFYSATPKIYNGEKPLNIDGTESTPLGRRPGIIVQKARYKIKIEREYTDFFKTIDKSKRQWMRGNCPYVSYRTKVFDYFDTFEFRKVGKTSLVVIVPGMCFTIQELSIVKHTIFWITYEALKWLAKKAKIKFDWTTLHLCQKPHICRATQVAWAKRVATNYSLNIDGKMLDSSSGKENWECEAIDENVVKAVDCLENWDNFATLQSDIKGLSKRVDGIEYEMLPSIQHSVDTIQYNVNTILKETQTIKDTLTPKSKPQDPDNPSYG